MKRKFAVLVLVLLSIGAGGCAVTIPHQFGVNESYLTHPDGYEVLGMTEGSASVTAVLFFPAVGDFGYRAAIQNATTKAQADALINVVSDVEYTNGFFFRTWKTTVRGLAVKKR